MKAALVWKANTGFLEKRHGIDVRCRKTEFIGQPRLGFELLACVPFLLQRSHEETWDVVKVAVDIFPVDVVFNLLHCGLACVQDGLGMVPSKFFHQVLQARVGYISKMSRRMRGIDSPAAIALDKRHL